MIVRASEKISSLHLTNQKHEPTLNGTFNIGCATHDENELKEALRVVWITKWSIRMPSGGCQRIENGPAEPETAGLLL
jgi:hypothetical protein